MTEAEKQAFLMFAGTMHGHAKATDQMIVGQSQGLRPMSSDLESKFAEVLQTPTQQYSSDDYQRPQQDNFESVEQAAREIVNMHSPVAADVNIVNLLKEINLNLVKIVTTLESNGGQKRTKSTRSA